MTDHLQAQAGDDLVARLRAAEAMLRRLEGRPDGDGGLCDEAADRIEALEARLETLGAIFSSMDGECTVSPDYILHSDCADWPRWLTGDATLVPVQLLRTAEARFDALQSQLEAADRLAAAVTEIAENPCMDPEGNAAIARAALAAYTEARKK